MRSPALSLGLGLWGGGPVRLLGVVFVVSVAALAGAVLALAAGSDWR